MTRGGTDTPVFTCKSQPSRPKCPVLPTEPLVHEHVELSRLAPWTQIVEPADGPDTIYETAFKAVVGERRSLVRRVWRVLLSVRGRTPAAEEG